MKAHMTLSEGASHRCIIVGREVRLETGSYSTPYNGCDRSFCLLQDICTNVDTEVVDYLNSKHRTGPTMTGIGDKRRARPFRQIHCCGQNSSRSPTKPARIA